MTAISVMVRGAGEVATAVAAAVARAGRRVLLVDLPSPLAIRRGVSVSDALFDGETVRLGLRASADAARGAPLTVSAEPWEQSVQAVRPEIVIDAAMRKTPQTLRAPAVRLSIGLGPGFEAPRDCDVVIETLRGPALGSAIRNGSAAPDTGLPAEVDGESARRVLYAPAAGRFEPVAPLDAIVEAGALLARLYPMGSNPLDIRAPFRGRLRGLLRATANVPTRTKCADVDPRAEQAPSAFTVSDRCEALGAAVVAVIRNWERTA